MQLDPKTVELSKIKQIELLASARPDTVSLAQGIPSFDTPDEVKRFAIRAIEDGRVAKYSLAPGLIELREAIEESLIKDSMHYDSEEEIIVTAGSIEAISATMLALLQSGDEVILFSPSYVSYRQSILLAKAKPVYVPLDEEHEWSINFEALLAALTSNTRVILICNPNNPTGSIFKKDDLLKIAQIAESRNLFVVLDEVYKDFIYDNRTFYSLATESKYRDRVIRVYSFSKAYAMTGWRIGYLHTSKELARRILAVHDGLVTCAPVVSQYAALGALTLPAASWQVYLGEYKARRDLLASYLDKIVGLTYTMPTASYFFFPKINRNVVNNYADSETFALQMLSIAGVATVPGSAFGPSGEDHLRLSFGRDRETISKGMERMMTFFKSHAD
ncbi:MAG: pyridoxal phosphate-dependent aminotransferase [Patescibacteria group bacterium]|jgi:aminotransferase